MVVRYVHMRCGARQRAAWLLLGAGVLLGGVLPQQPAGAAALSRPALARTADGPDLATPLITQTAAVAGLGYSLVPSTTEPYTPCPPTAESIECNLIIDPPPVKTPAGYRLPAGGPLLEGSGEKGGYAVKDIQSAYRISASGGTTQKVAIIDAYGDKYAESDLARYREKYRLAACTKANGCFNKVNERGEGTFSLPEAGEIETSWGSETSLDMDMVSAACPNCHIVVVEATNQNPADTAAAVGEAIKLGATEISDSYGYAENNPAACPQEKGCSEYLTAYDHPGIPVVVSAGDSGYDDRGAAPNWPATSPNVIAVGGTNLTKATNSRGWSETVWGGSGGGCSLYEAKPLWQTDMGCARRMDDDVAVVAEEVSIYSTPKLGGWGNVGGTSVGAPLIAGIEAHASSATRAEGAEAFYRSALFDVTSGSSGACAGSSLCTGEEGYDGPTGWGAPDGPPETPAGFHAVTAPATGVTSTGVKLNGYINPAGLKTTYHMEYGATTSYGATLPVPNANAGSGAVWQAVNQSVNGLQGAYHYRLVASNSSGTSYGEDHTFATIPWATRKTPNPGGSDESALEGVSCWSGTGCIAVASYNPEGEPTRWPLAESWNGTEWQIQSTPKPTGASYAVLYGVSCTSASACTAVGYDNNSAGTSVTLAERWDGVKWSAQTTPNPIGEKRASLAQVSCAAANTCVAVGKYMMNGSSSELATAEGWNGTEWSLQTIPNPEGAKASELRGVSCSSAKACLAVGRYTNSSGTELTLAETWNGTEWSVQSTPNPVGARASELRGVSCSSGACSAVGSYENGARAEATLAEEWNGAAWSIQSTPDPAGATESFLLGVSCASSSTCTAVGQDMISPGDEETFAESWNGTEWSLQGTPMPEEPLGLESALLYGISCATSETCVTVGKHVGYTKGAIGYYVTLAETFTLPVAETEVATGVSEGGATLNGTVNPDGQATSYHFEYGKTAAYGTSVPVPDTSLGSGTSSVKVSNAVTGLESGTTYHVRVVATDGSGISYGPDRVFTTVASWGLTATPNPAGAKASGLQKVSCTSSSACIAVGRYTNSAGSPETLVESWNGTGWKEQAVPNPTGAKTSGLEGVSCTSAGACTAVGIYEKSSGVSVPLAERWNGEEWSVQEPPAPTGAKESGLFEVSCTSAAACTAVGGYVNSTGTYLSLAEGWNGTSWSIEETPAPTGSKLSQLAGVSCTSSSSCTAVGEYENSAGTFVTLAEGWNGEKWSLQETPSVSGATITWFEGLSCAAAGECTAVGYYHTSSGTSLPLAERWNGKAWALQSTPSPAGSLSDDLRSISCTSSTACTAVGDYTLGEPVTEITLAEYWNGTEWVIQTTPNPSGAPYSRLHGVSCTSFTACATVGDYYKSSTSEESLTLAEIYG